ncbi:MAG: tetratricopeptide repeat protein [Isosphaeraceae bacterium]
MNDNPQPPSRTEFSVALAALAALAFLPAIGCGWVNWDDDINFLDNPDFGGLGLPGLAWAWKARVLGVFQPWSWLLLEAEYSAWGLKPFGYHALSLALHSANTVALFRVISSLMGRARGVPDGPEVRWAAAISSALWAIHPLRAEVVSWTSCQPYLPSILCSLLAILAYLRAQDGRPRRAAWLGLSLGLYGSAVLFKGIAVTLPFVLMILDRYPLRRQGLRPWLEKLPFLGIGLAIAVIGLRSRGAEQAPWMDRLASSGYSAWFYPIKTLAPIGLTVAYPVPSGNESGWVGLVAVVLATVLACGLRRRFPGLPACWLAYLIVLAPNSGLVESHRDTIACDRYAYASTMPLFVGLAAALSRLPAAGRFRTRASFAGLAAIVLVVLSWDQSASWKSSVTLYSRAEARGNAASHLIQNNLGEALFEQGHAREALDHDRRASDLQPHRPRPYFNVGVLCASLGRDDDAGRWFAEALRRNPHYLPARYAVERLRADGILTAPLPGVTDGEPTGPSSEDRDLTLWGASHDREVPP